MDLALGQLEGDGAALGIDQRMDPGGRSTVRATHATGSVVFLAMAACWRTHTRVAPII
jgi:hypothetical protein